MAKKESIFDIVKFVVSTLSEFLLSNIWTRIDEHTQELLEKVETKMRVIVERLIKRLIAMLFLIAGVIFLIVAVMLFSMDTLQLSRTQVFFIAGLFLLIIGLIMQNITSNNKK